jgi:hypothetical protein
MNTEQARPSAHEKTIALRHARLKQAVELTGHLYAETAAEATTNTDMVTRTLVTLRENHSLLKAHQHNLIDHIVKTTPPQEQDAAIAKQVRPITLSLEASSVAQRRLAMLLGETQ